MEFYETFISCLDVLQFVSLFFVVRAFGAIIVSCYINKVSKLQITAFLLPFQVYISLQKADRYSLNSLISRPEYEELPNAFME